MWAYIGFFHVCICRGLLRVHVWFTAATGSHARNCISNEWNHHPVCVRVCMCARARACVAICMYVCEGVCVKMCLCVCVCMCAYTCVCVCVRERESQCVCKREVRVMARYWGKTLNRILWFSASKETYIHSKEAFIPWKEPDKIQQSPLVWSPTVFVKHCECIAQKCTHLGRLPPHVSHLLLLRHCVLTWYGGKKKSLRKCAWPGIESKSVRPQGQVSAKCAVKTIGFHGPYCSWPRIANNLKSKPHVFVVNGKIQLMPKIMNHLFTYYSNCVGKSNPVCLIQQLPLVILLASYVQWLYFLIWPGKIYLFTFSHLC